MTPGDMRLRALEAEFRSLDNRRRDLDQGGDDVSRADVSQRWMDCARQVIAQRGTTRKSWRIKARVMLALIEAFGAEGPPIDAARSLATDLDWPVR